MSSQPIKPGASDFNQPESQPLSHRSQHPYCTSGRDVASFCQIKMGVAYICFVYIKFSRKGFFGTPIESSPPPPPPPATVPRYQCAVRGMGWSFKNISQSKYCSSFVVDLHEL